MVDVLSRRDARRLAVRAQVLTARRPDGVLDTIRRLVVLQHDPIAAVAPSVDLVLFSRLGSSYDPDELTDLVAQQRVVEIDGLLRDARDVRLLTADMAAWPGPDAPAWLLGNARWLDDNRGARRDVLDALRMDGPLTAGELPDTCARPWRSSGWNNHKNVTMLLGLLVQTGDVAVAGRRGREKLWDLAERVYPPDEPVPAPDARRIRDERRLASLGLVRDRVLEGYPDDLVGEVVQVEGVRGRWRADPALLARVGGPFEPRTALLSPFDRLLHDRKRLVELFEFEYALEMYKPAAQRRWGYYALPVLHGDRLVGKLDATADVRRGRLVVHALHEDPLDGEPWDDEVRDAVDAQVTDLARWLELTVER
ncbi:DNA glycosylase AlkZ-like family protein [Cellulomonas palmilytica]|uniref:DNA glycosylase AlkZ-like family protein n=1 Tax=Cellulomonas palmilytica TaxID=2608402 RepID=UPI001F3FB1DC|nr:crosslink repair DNA glycosylase YcaQ family protein [Cellulomonas palmilytica]UJP40017.1 YcaQ family DNA glycosylase [Cellulomonas palmilytica]